MPLLWVVHDVLSARLHVFLSPASESITDDNALLLSGFGKFDAYAKDTRRGRTPQTAETITLPPRRVVVFRLSRKFRVELNGSASS